jgi:hypothetical protein
MTTLFSIQGCSYSGRLHLIFDKSLGSLRDLFFLTYHQGITVDLSTFSKASKNRDYQAFNHIYFSLNSELKKRKGKREYPLYAIDSIDLNYTTQNCSVLSTNINEQVYQLSAILSNFS